MNQVPTAKLKHKLIYCEALPAGDRTQRSGSKDPLHYSNHSSAASYATVQSADMTKIYCLPASAYRFIDAPVSVSKSQLLLNSNV